MNFEKRVEFVLLFDVIHGNPVMDWVRLWS